MGRFRLPGYGNHAIRHIQVNIFPGRDCISYRDFPYVNIPLLRLYRYAAIVRRYRSLHGHIALQGANAHIAVSFNIACTAGFANDHRTFSCVQQYIALLCDYIFSYCNISIYCITQYAVACGNICIINNVAPVRVRLYDITGFHIPVVLYIPQFCICYYVVSGNGCPCISNMSTIATFQNGCFNIPSGIYIANKFNTAISGPGVYAPCIRRHYPGNGNP